MGITSNIQLILWFQIRLICRPSCRIY